MPVVDYDACVAGNINLTYASIDDETMLCAGYGGDSVVSFFVFLMLRIVNSKSEI